MNRLQLFNKLKHRANTPRSFFEVTPGIFFLTFLLGAINVVLIFQFFQLWSSAGNIVNIIVFPSQYVFENVFNVSITPMINIAVWILQLFYDFIIACLVRAIFIRPKKWEGLVR
jgi:hypothetical protein